MARDTFWDAWSNSAIRDWLVQHGHLRSDAQVKRDVLIELVNDKCVILRVRCSKANSLFRYNDYSARMAAYLIWPDARLRAYLREKGMDEEYLPTSRTGLLRENTIILSLRSF